MGKIVQLLAVAICLWTVGFGQNFATADDYEQADSLGDDYYIYKRSGFWSPHPSDYNPMRRPTHPVLRPSNKRDSEDVVFHPMARVTAMRQHQQQLRSVGLANEDINSEDYGEARPKKHILPSKLYYKSGGSSGYPSVRRP